MKLYGQKWVFQDGNHEIIVENAWSWSMFSQERIRVNGETVLDRSGKGSTYLNWIDAHKEPWLTKLGEETLSIQFKSGMLTVYARVMIDDRELEPADYFKGKWTSQEGHWPD